MIVGSSSSLPLMFGTGPVVWQKAKHFVFKLADMGCFWQCSADVRRAHIQIYFSHMDRRPYLTPVWQYVQSVILFLKKKHFRK